VYLHGLVRDQRGRKFSKSLGNGIDPLEIIGKYGADALRFTLARGANPGTDVPMIHAGSDARFFLLAGTFVGENALLRFYVLHCVFIPVVVTVLIAIHFWRIRKDGGISGPL